MQGDARGRVTARWLLPRAAAAYNHRVSSAIAVDRAPDEPVSDRRTVRIVFAGLLLVMFLAALDQTIVSTALPTIVGDLGGLNHLSWVVTAYLLAQTVVTPLYGKLGDLYGRKVVLQAALTIFLVGSALCGLSQNLDELIAFRALQGLGGGGLMVSAQASIGDVVPPRERGRYSGLFGAVFGLASVAGPLLGGILTTRLSWRWIFYVNLPLGIVAFFVLAAALPSVRERVHHDIDYLGITVLGAGISAIVLAASLESPSHSWTSPLISGLGLAGLVLLALFLPVERRAREPVLPVRLLVNRVFVVCSAVSLIVGFALFGAVVYLPLFLQVVKGSSPTASGLQLIPLMGGLLITSIASGQVITRTGRYRAFPIAGTAVMVLGLFLLTHLGLRTSRATVSLYMFVLGLGLGMVMQVLVLAVQNAVEYRDLGSATSGATLFRSIGGSLGTAVLGSIFSSRLTHELTLSIGAAGAARAHAGGVNPTVIHHLQEPLREHYQQAFSSALHDVFIVAGAVALAAFLLSWIIPELPLRETVTTSDVADTLAVPREADSLAEIINKIGRLDRREGAREIVRRVAARAGVDLSPAACWLLARYRADPHTDLEGLAHQVDGDVAALEAARGELVDQALITDTASAGVELTSAGDQALSHLTATGEQRLADLLRDWRPEEHEELARLIVALARAFFIDTTALREHLTPVSSGCGAPVSSDPERRAGLL